MDARRVARCFAIVLLFVMGITRGAHATAAPIPTCDGREATVIGTSSPDVLIGTPHQDVIVGLAGDDRILARDGVDVVCGNSGNDRIEGGEGEDILFGGDGDDHLDVGPKPDDPDLAPEEVTGGSGNDTIVERQILHVIAAPGPGDDTVRTNGNFTLDLSSSRRDMRVDLVHGIATGEGRDTLGGVPDVLGSHFDDVLIGNDLANRLAGNLGSDRILGRRGPDSLDGAAGVVEGLRSPRFWPSREKGNDTLDGGPGRDSLLGGGGGDDTYIGGAGTDHLDFRRTRRELTVDLEVGFARGEGRDTISGIEDVDGGPFPDRLMGDDGPNRILGWYADAEDDDHIEGRDGNDELLGSRGDDVLLGGPGRDRIDGSFGTDHCFGGEDLAGCEVTMRPQEDALPAFVIAVAIGAASIVAVAALVRARRRAGHGS